MLKQTTISLLLMQILLAAGADYTLPEVEKKLNELQIIPLAIPDGIPNPTKIHYTPMPEQICGKCGKKYQLSSEYQSIMAANLLEHLQQLAGNDFSFAWDKSKISPCCSEGRLYLRFGQHAFRYNPETKIYDKFYFYRSVPVGVAELIEMMNFFKGSPGGYIRRKYFDGYSFVVVTGEQFSQKIFKPNMSEEDTDNIERITEKKRQIGEIYQQLTEQATILRKKDLAGMLKKFSSTAELSVYNAGRGFMLTRCLITDTNPSAWMPFKCPSCGKKFFVLDGTNYPDMLSLSYLFGILKKFDLELNYASLCPYCHPESEAARQLEVKLNFADKQIKSTLAPHDFELIYGLFIEDNALDNPNGNKVTPAQMSRLREILLGKSEPNGGKISFELQNNGKNGK